MVLLKVTVFEEDAQEQEKGICFPKVTFYDKSGGFSHIVSLAFLLVSIVTIVVTKFTCY